MAQTDIDLGEHDYDEDEKLIQSSDRKLITQQYDLSINTLIEQWNDGTLHIPEIQRQYVWDNGKASRLIESLILNIPIPVVYFAETEDVSYEIIDGHQRINSIVRYINNEYGLSGVKVLHDYSKLRFHQLPQFEQRKIKTRVIRAIIISSDSDPEMKFEVFERLNTGSIALNAQEIRNSTHRGRMNSKIKELTDGPTFRFLVGTEQPRRRMVDNELILRFFALYKGYESYKAPLSIFLNSYLDESNQYSEEEVNGLADKFTQTLDLIADVFHEHAFRLTDERGGLIDRSLNRALAEAQLVSFSKITSSPEAVKGRRDEILKNTARLHRDESFLNSIQKATGNKSNVTYRIQQYLEALVKSGIKI